MTNREAQQIVTRLAGDLRALVNTNPDCLRQAAIFIHDIPESEMPRQFKMEKDWGAYRTYTSRHPDGGFSVTAFTKH